MKKSPYFWLSIILSIILVAVFLWRSGEQEEGVFSPDIKGIKADLVLYGVSYKRDTIDSLSKWLINADIARFFEKKQEIDFETVRVVFFTDNKEPIKVKAKRGNYDISRGVLSVFGDVVVKGISGYTLFTESLFYFPKKNTIEAPKVVKLIGDDGNELIGNDMRYFIKKHKLLLYLPKVIIKEDDIKT